MANLRRQRVEKELVARITYAAQIDLRLGDLACEHLNVDAGMRPGDLTSERSRFFALRLISVDRQAQPVAEGMILIRVCGGGSRVRLVRFGSFSTECSHRVRFDLNSGISLRRIK
jgi:hypothetical protein